MQRKISFAAIGLLLSLCFSLELFANSYTPSGQPAPVITASAAVLMDAESGVIIYSKDMNTAYYPASITKIMTALLAIENSDNDYEQRIEFSRSAVFSIPYGASHIAMDEGETLSLEESLMGLMLESANEVGNAIAEHIAGTTDAFAELMTKRAQELGAVNTKFVNAHGLHEDDHYTTALDMAYIAREAAKHPKFNEVISTTQLYLPPTEKQTQSRPLNNSHKMIQPGHRYYNEYVLGGKTGFTSEAGNTLVTYAKKDNMSLIAVILHDESSSQAYEDTDALLDYGFHMFDDVKIFNASEFHEKISIVESMEGGSAIDSGTIDVYAEHDVTMFLPANINSYDIRKELDMPYQMSPPVSKDEKVGSVKLMYMDSELASVDLFAGESAVSALAVLPERVDGDSGGMKGILKIALCAVGVLVAAFILYVFAERSRRKKKRELARIRREKIARRQAMDVNNYRNFRYR